jgi:putative transposase
VKKHRKPTSLFQLIDRKKFDALVIKWEMDKWVRELKTWEFTCALLTMMTVRLESHREVEKALDIPRSTFGDALVARSHGFFEELCDLILFEIRGRTRDRKVKRAIRQILAIDSTECRVHGSLFSSPGWKLKQADGHQAAAKLHVVWNIDGEWIEDYIITGVRRCDSPVSLQFELVANKTYVFDRAYNDLTFWLKIKHAGSHFVTRLKSQCIARLTDGKKAEGGKNKKKVGVLYDGIYKPCLGALVDIPKEDRAKIKFRYVVYRDPDTKKIFYFVTSDFKSSAQTIADIYKKRWAVELLFRWLKGHLDIRYLEAKDKNAVKVQLATAVLLQLLLQLKKIVDHYAGTLWEFLRDIRTTLIRQSLCGSQSPNDCRWRSVPTRQSVAGFF